ncbi:MAG: MBL fold metallo-hydrolase [Oscillospiraceae bacterium]|nr:MBL fold metallo-hydrolase [Oscillospiraceae bacterium]
MCEIHRIKCGNVNCYILKNGSSAILVDTGKKEHFQQVLEACKAFHVKLIVLTHAHFDHAENAAQLSSTLDIPIGMHESDCDLLPSNFSQALSASTFLGKIVLSASLKEFAVHTVPEVKPDVLLREGDSLSSYGIDAQVLALPGHTDGSIGLDVEHRHLLVGDALMNMFYPTVSMLYHDRDAMLKSAGKISSMGSRTIYFGHGKPVSNRKWG